MTSPHFSERLAQPFRIEDSINHSILYPDHQLEIDEWLTSAAETDEELRELEIPRVWFLQNHWEMERLAVMDWISPPPGTRRSVWAVYIDGHVYFVFSGGFKYWLFAATDRSHDLSTYRDILRSLLKNRSFVPTPPERIRYTSPDLDPHLDDHAGASTIDAARGPLDRGVYEKSTRWVDTLTLGLLSRD